MNSAVKIFSLLLIASLSFQLLIASNANLGSDPSSDYNEELFQFSIRYLGMSVANVELYYYFNAISKSGRIDVWAKSKSLGSLLFRLDNHYWTLFEEDFIPIEYSKTIDQKGFKANRTSNFSEKGLKVTVSSDSTVQRVLLFEQQGRDFFSSLLYLRELTAEEKQGETYLFANHNLWRVSFVKTDNELINRASTEKFEFTFEKLSVNKSQRSDVLTNNIVNEENNLLIWFTDDDKRLPVKAEYPSNPFPVTWVLDEYNKHP